MKIKFTKLRDPDFFVVGLQKSGTSWVTALLNAHPEIRNFPALYGGFMGQKEPGEGRIFDMLKSIDEDGGVIFRDFFLNNHDKFYADLVGFLEEIPRDDLYDKFISRYREWCGLHSEGKRLIGDKTARYVFCLDFIDRFYPKSKKICIVRDPKDRIVSWHFHQLLRDYKKEKNITDDFVRHYCKIRIIPEYKSMLAYRGFLHCFTYEHLTYDTRAVLLGILEYLGADTREDIIDTMIEEGSLEKGRKKDMLCADGKNKKRGEEVRGSHYRRGVIEDWKNYLSGAQVNVVDALTSDLERQIFEKYTITQC